MGILDSILSYLGAKRIKQEEKVEEKLRIHFEDIERQIIFKIIEMSNNLYIVKGRLQFGGLTPIKTNYPFEDEDTYPCFQLHFPEEAKEWDELKTKATKKKGELASFFRFHQGSNAEFVANEHIESLQTQFKDFAQKLAKKAEHIGKYQIGSKEFNKLNKCPICKKF